MRLARPEGTYKNEKDKASSHKVREVEADLEGKYSCYIAKKFLYGRCELK